MSQRLVLRPPSRASLRKALGDYFEQPVACALAKAGVSANAVTLVGLVVAGFSAGLIGGGYLLAGGIVLLSSGLFDMLDGALARATNKATRFGALLDSAIDRVSEAAILLGALVFYLNDGEKPGVVLAFLALVGSLMVSYIRARAEGLGIDCEVGVMTRSERVVILAAALVVAQWWEPALTGVLGAIAALGLATAAYRIVYAWRKFEEDDRG